MVLVYILIFVFVLGIVVLVHELGHFIFAKRAGILCHEFSIGMGPALYKWKRGETVYAIRAIPIGGYVSAAGEDPETSLIKENQTIFLLIRNNIIQKIYFNKPESIEVIEANVVKFDLYGKDNEPLFIEYESNGQISRNNVKRDAMYVLPKGQEIQVAPYERCYESKPWLKRFLFVVMGAGFNFLLAVIVFIIVNLVRGIPSEEPVIANPQNANYVTPANKTLGLEKGDRITKLVSGSTIKEIKTWQDITDFMNGYTGGEITITYERKGLPSTKSFYPAVTINTIGLVSNEKANNDTIIGYISGNSKADKSDLQIGDKITKINNKPVANWFEIETELRDKIDGETVKISYLRGTNPQELDVEIKPLKALSQSQVSDYMIGINPIHKFNLFKSIGYGFRDTVLVIGSVFQTLEILFTNNNVGVGDLSGPVGIFDMTKTFAMGGFVNLLWWIGFISANIGFVNLLPLPALDGGRLIFLLIEGVSRKPVNRKVEGYIHTIGFILFMMLFVYITINDIIRLRG